MTGGVTGPALDVVTGAFGYTGRYIARRLLAYGRRVRTLTSHPRRSDPLWGQVETSPLDFDDPAALARSMEGAETLYHTYWIRFSRGRLTFERAVDNCLRLVEAARAAGLRRIVYISITGADLTSPLPYFRGKAQVEEAIRSSGLSWAILRPTVIFGAEDVLVNNMSWFLRRFPLFPVPGDGEYEVQPVYVDDVAALAISLGMADSDVAMDAVGPETYSFNGLLRALASAIGSGARLVHVAPWAALAAAKGAGLLLRDVVLTADEIRGLMASLLVSRDPPTCPTPFSRWVAENADRLGRRYASEVARHYR